MSLPEPRRLARHVAPEPSPARLDRQWIAVEARLQRAGGAPLARAWRMPAVGAALLAIALVVVWRRPAAPEAGLGGAALEGGDGDALTLPTGERLSLVGPSRVEIVRSRDMEIVLRRGGVDLDLPHREGRRLVVHAGRFDVLDVGTRFRVELGDDGECRVSVAEGEVDVRPRDGGGASRQVHAGDAWSSAPKPAAPPPDDSAVVAPPATAPAAAPASSGKAGAAAAPQATPAALLEAATRARNAGNPRDAAIAFDTLRRRYRSDSRAAIAAFELGRLRFDTFGDAPAAAEAWNDAITLAPGGPLREDAEARRIQALEAYDPAACADARDAYLRRYPAGIHATMVARRCPGR